eukprot:g26404.t1
MCQAGAGWQRERCFSSSQSAAFDLERYVLKHFLQPYARTGRDHFSQCPRLHAVKLERQFVIALCSQTLRKLRPGISEPSQVHNSDMTLL